MSPDYNPFQDDDNATMFSNPESPDGANSVATIVPDDEPADVRDQLHMLLEDERSQSLRAIWSTHAKQMLAKPVAKKSAPLVHQDHPMPSMGGTIHPPTPKMGQASASSHGASAGSHEPAVPAARSMAPKTPPKKPSVPVAPAKAPMLPEVPPQPTSTRPSTGATSSKPKVQVKNNLHPKCAQAPATGWKNKAVFLVHQWNQYNWEALDQLQADHAQDHQVQGGDPGPASQWKAKVLHFWDQYRGQQWQACQNTIQWWMGDPSFAALMQRHQNLIQAHGYDARVPQRGHWS